MQNAGVSFPQGKLYKCRSFKGVLENRREDDSGISSIEHSVSFRNSEREAFRELFPN